MPNDRSVYFKNVDGTQKNLLCEHPSYRSSIMRQLPQLTNMDGERLKHADSLYSEVPTSPKTLNSLGTQHEKPAGGGQKVVLPKPYTPNPDP